MNKIFMWDYKEQMPIDDIAEFVNSMYTTFIYKIDTGGDEYAILVTNIPLHPTMVQEIWKKWNDLDEGIRGDHENWD